MSELINLYICSSGKGPYWTKGGESLVYRWKFKAQLWMGLFREMSVPKAERQSKESILGHYTIFEGEKEHPEIICNM